MSDLSDPTRPLPEDLFAAWCDRFENGTQEPIEEILSRYPGHAEAIREMHEDWLQFAPILERVVPGLIRSEIGLATLSQPDATDPLDLPAPQLIESLGVRMPDGERYRFRSVLGRGGGGVVIKTWDRKLHRTLAMKIVLGRSESRPTGDTPPVDVSMMTRFVNEARIASQLDHPGIVPVHELGADESGRAFFTMRLIQGEDLSHIFARVRDSDPDWTQVRALGAIARACEAVAFAHENGVIHRDLKPANIMVGNHGEVHVMDWGLAHIRGLALPDEWPAAHQPTNAKRVEPHWLTHDGDVLGTPAYMAPEQARGELRSVSARSDVYAIGAMLYELLTGRPPFVDDNADALTVLRRLRSGAPTAIGRLAPEIPIELVAICERAMARRQEDRYADVRALERDLRAYLEGRVVAAYESGAWAEMRKWVRRNPVLSMAACGLFLTLAVGFAITTTLMQEARRERDLKDSALISSRASQYDQSILGARVARASGEFENAHRMLETAPRELRDWEHAYLSANLDRSLLRIGEVRSFVQVLALSPANERLFIGDGLTGRLFDLNTGSLIARLPGHETAWIHSAQFSPEGDSLLTAAFDATVRLWNTRTGDLVRTFRVSEDRSDDDPRPRIHDWLATQSSGINQIPARDPMVVSAQFDPDGSRITATALDRVVAWDVASGTESFRMRTDADSENLIALFGWHSWVGSSRFTVASHVGTVGLTCSSIDERGDWIAIGMSDGSFVRCGFSKSRKAHKIGVPGHDESCEAIRISPDGSRIAIAYAEHGFAILDASTERRIGPIDSVIDRPVVRDIRFLPNPERVLLIGDAVRIWDCASNRSIREWRGALSTALDPSGTRILTGYSDGLADLRDASTGEVIAILSGHEGPISAVHISRDGSKCVTGGRDVRVWDLTPMAQSRHPMNLSPTCAAISSHLGLVAAVANEACHVFDLNSWESLGQFRVSGTSTLDFAESCARLVVGCRNGDLAIFDPFTGRRIHRVMTDRGEIQTLAVDSKAETVVFTSEDAVPRSWNVAAGTVTDLSVVEGPISSVAVSSDGSLVALASVAAAKATGSNLHICDLRSRERLRTIATLRQRILSMQFSPDGRTIAAASEDLSMRAWGVSDGTERFHASLAIPADRRAKPEVIPLSFHPRQTRIAAGAFTVQCFDVSSGEERVRDDDFETNVQAVRFSRDGTMLATVSQNGEIRVLDSLTATARRSQREAARRRTIEIDRRIRHRLQSRSDLVAVAGELLADAAPDSDSGQSIRRALAKHAEAARAIVRRLRVQCPLKAEIELRLERVDCDEATREFARDHLAQFEDNPSDLSSFAQRVARLPGKSNEAQLDQALRCARRAAALVPNSPSILTALGAAELRRGDVAASLRASEQARELYRELDHVDPENIAYLTIALWQTGATEEARDWLEKMNRNASSFVDELAPLLQEVRELVLP